MKPKPYIFTHRFLQRAELSLESVRPNIPVEDSLFRIAFPPGTELSHNDYGISEVVMVLPKEAEAEHVLGQADFEDNAETEMKDAGRTSYGPWVDSNDSVDAYPPAAGESLYRRYIYGLAVIAVVAVVVLLAVYAQKAKRQA